MGNSKHDSGLRASGTGRKSQSRSREGGWNCGSGAEEWDQVGAIMWGLMRKNDA